MAGMGKKRFNPYEIRSAEITKFRGITDENEIANADDAYASGMSNVESFKIRSLNLRTGQQRDDEYDIGSVHQGTSAITARAQCVGTGLYIEAKTNIFAARPKKYPWRNVIIPIVYEDVPRFSITTRCRQIDTPSYATAREGYENYIVSAQTWMDCFMVTCEDIWGIVGELDGYEQVASNASSEFDMTNALDGGCYSEIAEPKEPELPPDTGGGGPIGPLPPLPPPPVIPPITPYPPFPPLPQPPDAPDTPVFPTIPGIDVPDVFVPPVITPDPDAPDVDDETDVRDNNPCRRTVNSFVGHGNGPTVVTLIEDYLDEVVLTFTMSASITSPNSWTTECGISASLSEFAGFDQIKNEGNLAPSTQAVIKSVKYSVAGGYGCSKSGTAKMTLTILKGYKSSKIFEGSVRSWAIGESNVSDLKVYICDDVKDIVVNGVTSASTSSFGIGILGGFPTINDYLAPFAAGELETVISDSVTHQVENTTTHGCKSGALNVSWQKGRKTVTSFKQNYTIPTVGGATKINGMFIWTQVDEDNGVRFGNGGRSFEYDGGSYCCGWYSVSEQGVVESRSYVRGYTQTTKDLSKIIEVDGQYTAGDIVEIDFGTPAQTSQIPSGDPETRYIESSKRSIYNLKFLVLSVG